MHKIGYFLTEGFQVMALGTQSVFEFANVVAKEQVYKVTNYSLTGGVITSSIGASVNTELASSESQADTWMVSGIVDPLARDSTVEELDFVKSAAGRAQRCRWDVHGRIRARRGRIAWSACHHALGVCRRPQRAFPEHPCRGRPDLHQRRDYLDLGRALFGHGSGAGYGRE